MKFSLKKIWPWLLLIAIPLWLIAVTAELLDARLLEKEGVPTTGRMESPEWVASGRGGRLLAFDAVWSHEGREYRRRFRVPSADGGKFVDSEGRQIESRLEMRYAPSKPEVASIAIQPPDPSWVSLILACVGFCILCGVIWFLIDDWRGRPRR